MPSLSCIQFLINITKLKTPPYTWPIIDDVVHVFRSSLLWRSLRRFDCLGILLSDVLLSWCSIVWHAIDRHPSFNVIIIVYSIVYLTRYLWRIITFVIKLVNYNVYIDGTSDQSLFPLWQIGVFVIGADALLIFTIVTLVVCKLKCDGKDSMFSAIYFTS